MTLSIVIPTYQREQVLVDTIDALLTLQTVKADEIVIVDQTEVHEPSVAERLTEWHESQDIRWIKRDEPSIPHAMNVGLHASQSTLVLFLDDDIIPHQNLVAEHIRAHCQHPAIGATVGQVLQPDETSKPSTQSIQNPINQPFWLDDLKFPFWSNQAATIHNCMAGNLCVKKVAAIAIDGFDNHFPAVAHRFETDFAKRFVLAGNCIMFWPTASIDHLRITAGGTRTYYSAALTSASPTRAVGDYYFALKFGQGWPLWRYIIRRLRQELFNKTYLFKPWLLPFKCLAEWRGMKWGYRLYSVHKNRKKHANISPTAL